MVKHDPQKHHRRSIRLKEYDYGSPGAYFVTICTRGHECILDDHIVSGIVRSVWGALPKWFPTIVLDEFVLMPNHVHFILWIHPPDVGATLAVAPNPAVAPHPSVALIRAGDVEAGASPAPTEWTIPEPQQMNPNPSLGDVVGAFKSLVFKVYLGWIQTCDPTRQAKFWQRNYYEHIIRNERELRAIRRYIRQNSDNWEMDRDNPDNVRHLSPPKTMDEYVYEAMTSDT
jgi:putative transposase